MKIKVGKKVKYLISNEGRATKSNRHKYEVIGEVLSIRGKLASVRFGNGVTTTIKKILIEHLETV